MESFMGHLFSFLIPQSSLSNFLRLFLLLPFLFFVLKWYWNKRKKSHLFEILPSAKLRSFNFLGHMHYMTKRFLYKNPAPLHAYHSMFMNAITQAYGKDGIVFVWMLFRPTISVHQAESVEMILNHSTEIKKSWFYRFLHPWLGEGLLTSDGSKWRQRRKLLTPAFHFNILKDFLPVMNKQAKIFVEVLKQHTSSKCVDIVPLVTKCSFDIICETILGEEMQSQTLTDCDYLNSISIITEMVTERMIKAWLWSDLIFYLSNNGRKYRHHVHKVKKFSIELISKKKKEKLESKIRGKAETVDSLQTEDIYLSRKRRALLDLLLDEAIENKTISEEEIREEVDTFTFEGHDTTSMAMSWSLYLIGLHPDIQAKIHAELDSIFGADDRDPTIDDLRDMKYLECVFKETLRIYPSVPGYGRQLQQDINFKGHFLPKGSTCFIWAYMLHRDPEVFPNPEKFDPDRFKPENSINRHPFAYVPFSAGLRNCIGQKFAVMEEKCVLSAILRKYTIRSLQPRDQVHDLFEVVLRPHGGLKLEIRERRRQDLITDKQF